MGRSIMILICWPPSVNWDHEWPQVNRRDLAIYYHYESIDRRVVEYVADDDRFGIQRIVVVVRGVQRRCRLRQCRQCLYCRRRSTTSSSSAAKSGKADDRRRRLRRRRFLQRLVSWGDLSR